MYVFSVSGVTFIKNFPVPGVTFIKIFPVPGVTFIKSFPAPSVTFIKNFPVPDVAFIKTKPPIIDLYEGFYVLIKFLITDYAFRPLTERTMCAAYFSATLIPVTFSNSLKNALEFTSQRISPLLPKRKSIPQ